MFFKRLFSCKYGECISFKNKWEYEKFCDEWYEMTSSSKRPHSKIPVMERIPGQYYEIDSEYSIFDSFKLWWVGLKSDPFTKVQEFQECKDDK